MKTILATIDNEEIEFNFEGEVLDCVKDFVARHFCGEHFYAIRPASAQKIAENILLLNTDLENFDGFTFKTGMEGKPVKIEIVV